MRVQTSNFQAEYGRSSGATITVVTRSGSKDWRGSAAYYKRDDALNGNEFSRRQQCGLGQHRAVRRRRSTQFDNTAWTLGGPGAGAGHRLQPGAQQAVLLLVAGPAVAHRPGRAQPAPHADRARAPRRFLADVRHQRRPGLRPRSAARRATAAPRPADRPASPATSSRRTGSTPWCRRCSTCSRCRTRAIRPARNQYNYTFQTVQDWPRNDQVLRMDWNVAREHDVLLARAVGLREACAGGVVAARVWWRLAAAAEQVRRSTASASSTRCCTPSARRSISEVTVGVNWAHQNTERARPGGAGRQRPDARPARVPQFFPQANPDNMLPKRHVRRRHSRDTIAPFNADNRWPFFGYNTPVELLRQPDQDQGRAQPQDRAVRRAHDPAGTARLHLQRLAQLQHRRLQPAQHEHRASPTGCSARSRSTRSRTAIRARTASS